MEEKTTKNKADYQPQDDSGKSSYELKKQERERIRGKEHRRTQVDKMKKTFMKYGLWILMVFLVGYSIFVLVDNQRPDGEDFSVSYDIQGREHIENGATHPSYNSNPPSSGWHYVSPARGGFYGEPLPDEQVIHNLEHGDIWIAYHPDLNDEIKDILESFAGQYVVVSPRADNEGDISLVAWGRVDTFNIENGIVNENRIKDFIKRYDNRGPESVRSVQSGHSGF